MAKPLVLCHFWPMCDSFAAVDMVEYQQISPECLFFLSQDPRTMTGLATAVFLVLLVKLYFKVTHGEYGSKKLNHCSRQDSFKLIAKNTLKVNFR